MSETHKNLQKESLKRPPQQPERPLILLHDDEDALFRLTKEILARDVYFQSFDFKKFELGLDPAVVIIRARHIQDAAAVMHDLQTRNSLTEFIVIGSHWTVHQIKDLINSFRVHRILSFPVNQELLQQVLKSALVSYEYSFSRNQLYKESTGQNKNLEILNANLEKIVEERTLHIRASKDEEEKRTNQLRQMMRFIKELAMVTSVDDLLMMIKKDLRKLSRVGEPLFVFQVHPEWTEIYTCQSNGVFRSKLKQNLHLSPTVQIHDVVLGRQLATAFGRPLAGLISIPLEVKFSNGDISQESSVSLCIEASLKEEEAKIITDYFSLRKQAIGITIDRLLLEVDLVEYSYRWEKTFDGLRDPISIVNDQHLVLRANRKFSEKIIQKNCYQAFAQRDKPCEGCEIQTALKTNQSKVFQVRRADRLYEVHSYPIQINDQKQSTHLINQYVDITESRNIYIQLLQSEKMGALGLLAGNIAHELNNPLTGLRSLAQVLVQQEESRPQLQSDLQEIEKAAARSQEIIKNLMEFARGGSGHQVEMTLDEVVNKTMPMLKTVIRRHRYQIHLDAETARVKVVPHLLQQVVFNLINNACQAMTDSGTLTIETGIDAAQARAYLLIIDSGPGIPENIKEKIFEPFFTTKKEGQGTGLGLSFSRDVVRGMGGDIKLKSEMGIGSQFRVELPLVQG